MIQAILYCEFDPTAGPKIVCQDPEDFISREIFDANHSYIITKPQFQNKIIIKTVDNFNIIGCPIYVEDDKYDRNAFIFNICFVCEKNCVTDSLEPVVKKLSEYMKQLEKEEEILSNELKKQALYTWLRIIRTQLNTNKMCSLIVGDGKMIHLKIANYIYKDDKFRIKNHHVPVIIPILSKIDSCKWDITMQQILLYIDGFNHVKKISLLADVELTFVKACVETLFYKELVKIVPIIQYSNCYMCLPDIHKIMIDDYLQMQCQKFVSTDQNILPQIKNILLFYASMTHGTSLANLCEQYNPHSLKINERKLVLFGLVQGFIRQIKKYPITLSSLNSKSDSHSSPNVLSETHSSSTNQNIKTKLVLDGTHSFDEICCEYNMSQAELDAICDEMEGTIIMHT